MKREELATYIDQTTLSPGTTSDEIKQFCLDARKEGFASVCILPVHVPLAKKILEGSETKVCTVVSFPLGMDTAEVKLYETEDAIKKGAYEIDVVLNVGAVKEGNKQVIMNELRPIANKCHEHGCILKVIIEMPLLTDEQSVNAALWVEESGADFVKTSTGFKGLKLRATTAQDIELLRSVLKSETKVKAAGGIRTTDDAMAVIEAGANRIGASSGKNILDGLSS